MSLKHYFTFLFMLFQLSVFAQDNFSISGTVRDEKETIPGAAIYLSGTKISTITNTDGKFTISKLPAGNYDVLVQVVGYLPYSKSVIISDKSVNMDVLLTSNPVMLNEVVIKPDPNRLAYLSLFKEFFIGRTPNAKDCKILNSEVLNIDYDKQRKVLTVSSKEFLIIENKALGYNIKYMLQNFEYDYRTRIVYFAGFPFFEEMKGSKSKINRWNKKRNTAYFGSSQHFFQSLYESTSETEGFVIHKLATIGNKNRHPDSVINANIKRLTAGSKAINMLTFNRDDSLNFWLKERSKPKAMAVLNKAKVLTDTLVKTYNQDIKYINFTDELFVMYTKEKETEEYSYLGFQVSRAPDMGNYQVSLINLVAPPMFFYKNGSIANPRSSLYKGFWAYEKMADAVPIEFKPIEIK
ncbi:carboxypeptidase-like regulatory domain-containing protein [Pedobacter chitinilyticus]|uniref:Carboxypeptidase-like regulatory domain-containing protein n=2 Tax=Pedobacter chitinilyticus TaxID=2233776 RepID=A0A3S3R6X7_9SPHI|nr:carboxypeptidase-like regulatory domain-containing protein [Pedobacter chitinilyticus]RWU08268.1 carboxypeptidase-like regulatory domain-containing protein [Pedobacter chitinilyticus]